jgi:predicted dehydrogenase
MQPLRIAVIGVGRLGQAHARLFSGMPDVVLVGVFDTDGKQAAEISKRHQTQAFSDMRPLFQAVDAVSVVVPTSAHYEVASQALSQGLHTFIEKPITTSMEEADALIRLADTHRRVLQIGHIERFNGAVRSLEGMSISPGFIESHRLASFDPRGTDVSVVHDLMIHDIDLIRYLVRAEVKKIEATGVAVISDQIDIANARIQFTTGCVANVTASRISMKKMRKMRLFQRDAYISLDFLEGTSEIYRLIDEEEAADVEGVMIPINTGDDRSRRILRQQSRVQNTESLSLELSSFVEAIRSDSPPPVTGEDGREALRISLEIIHQIEQQRVSM